MTKSKLVPVLVGQLLVESGMLEKPLLELALDRARESEVKIGQILLYSGLVNERDLKAALSAQRMLRQSLISFKQAVDALRSVRLYNMPYEVALARARWLTTNEQIHQFAKLLVDAGIVPMDCLGPALAIAVCQNHPLGRVLVTHNNVDKNLRRTALEAVIMIRSGEITYHHAVAVMRAVVRTGREIHDLLGSSGSQMKKLTDELVSAQVLSEDEVLDIIEQTLQREAIWRASLIGKTIVANLKFAASLSINRMLADGSISVRAARDLCNELLLSTASVLRHMEGCSAEIQPALASGNVQLIA